MHGGVQDKKRRGSERLKAVLDEVKRRGVVTEGELAEATGLDKRTLGKYIEYLQEKEIIQVRRRLLKEAEISIAGGGVIKRRVTLGSYPETPSEHEEAQSSLLAPEPTAEPTPKPGQESGFPLISKPQAAVNYPPPTPEAEVGTETTAAAEAAPEAASGFPEKPEATPKPEAEIEVPKPEGVFAPPGREVAPTPGAITESVPKPEAAEPLVVTGEPVKPGTEEEFREVCKSLTTDFVGAMRLYGEVDGQSYTAGLLIDKGDIVAVSFEHMDTVEVTFGDDAMREIQTRFAGTKGDLEIFEMNEDDMSESLRPNVNYMISQPVRLSSMRIKIKSRFRPAEQPKGRRSLIGGVKGIFSRGDAAAKRERREMVEEMRKRKVGKLSGGINLVDFARNLKIDPLKAKRFEELRKQRQKGGPALEVTPEGVTERKAARAEELKLKKSGAGVTTLIPGGGGPKTKQERMDEIRRMKGSDPIEVEKDDKTPVKRVQEGKRIETNIDKLYELVKSRGRLKINEALAGKLNVTKAQIEEWAMILEEHNLLELRYPTIGEPEIICSQPGKQSDKPSEKTDKKEGLHGTDEKERRSGR